MIPVLSPILILPVLHLVSRSFLLCVDNSDVSVYETILGTCGLVSTACQQSVTKSKYHTIHSYPDNLCSVNSEDDDDDGKDDISVVNESLEPSPLPISTYIFLS